VVKHVDAVELCVVVAAVLAVAADAVHVQNLSRRNSPEAGSTRQRKGGEDRGNVLNSVWQFGTGNRKCRWHAREYPEQENEVILPLLPHDLWAPCKARWVYLLRPRARCSSPRPAPRHCCNRRRTIRQMYSGAD
jgi:hypothetical protein